MPDWKAEYGTDYDATDWKAYRSRTINRLPSALAMCSSDWTDADILFYLQDVGKVSQREALAALRYIRLTGG